MAFMQKPHGRHEPDPLPCPAERFGQGLHLGYGGEIFIISTEGLALSL